MIYNVIKKINKWLKHFFKGLFIMWRITLNLLLYRFNLIRACIFSWKISFFILVVVYVMKLRDKQLPKCIRYMSHAVWCVLV